MGLMIITATGGTDPYPSSTSDYETLVVLILVMIGAGLWTMIIASFVDVAANGDPSETEFRQQLDGLNSYIAFNNIPTPMAQRLRSYMMQQRGLQLRQQLADRALPSLSLQLQLEVVQHVHRLWLGQVWFVRELEAPVKVRLAFAMESKVMAPGEVAPNRYLYVISRGTIIFGGLVLCRGGTWGDDIILSNPDNFVPFLARAITYTDVQILARDVLYAAVAHYPASAARLRRDTIFLALRRYVIRIGRECVRNPKLKASIGLGKIKLSGDIMDRVDSAVSSTVLSASEEQSMKLALELECQAVKPLTSPLPRDWTATRTQSIITPAAPAPAPSELETTLQEILRTQLDLQQALHRSQRETSEAIKGLRRDVQRLERRGSEGSSFGESPTRSNVVKLSEASVAVVGN